MHALGHDVLKPSELQKNDVVAYWKGTGGPFCDMMVHRIEDNGVFLRRPYIDASTGKAAYEELFWLKDSNFLFLLISRPSL